MKKIAMTILIMMILSPLGAIGFGYHVFEVRTEQEFSNGIFPTSVKYQFNFPMPDFIKGRRTVLAFRLDNGLVYRNLRQHPDTGEFLSRINYSEPTEYTVLFDEFNLFFAQGFFETRSSKKDLLTAFLSIDGRFENAYERLSWLSDSSELEGVFNTFVDGVKTDRFSNSSYIGAPELSISRSMFQTSISLGFVVDWMEDSITRRDGIKMGSYLRLSPSWMPLSTGMANFLVWWNEIDAAKTLYSYSQSSRDLTLFSIVLDDKLIYRYIYGDKVPAYVQGGDIWGDGDAPNTAHVITNRLSLTIYGPQMAGRDTYPSLLLFWDFGLSLGHPLNSESKEFIVETVGSYGLRASLLIFGIVEVYYEVGCVYDGAFYEESYVEQRFGITVGV